MRSGGSTLQIDGDDVAAFRMTAGQCHIRIDKGTAMAWMFIMVQQTRNERRAIHHPFRFASSRVASRFRYASR